MSAQIKEALAALDILAGRRLTDPRYNGDAQAECERAIGAALEAARQEAEAWEVIERYWTSGKVARRFLSIDYNGVWFVHLGPEVVFGESSFRGSTRLEALTRAAAWCRAELSK